MSNKAPEICTLFAGPSLQGIDKKILCAEGLELRPPIKRGDIAQIVMHSSPSNIAIVDGVFHAHPAVGHSEILDALSAGWRIWGLSSMGAIRACEMNSLGMTGFGEVYRQFASDLELSDDEVTLIHQTQEPYLALSEPLIHIRHFLKKWTTQQIITQEQEQEQQILTHLKNMWYGHRTLNRLKKALLALSINEKQIDNALAGFSDHRIKTLDLTNFLILKPWTRTVKSNDSFPDIK